MRFVSTSIAAAAAIISLAACGQEGIDVESDLEARGAQLFSERCAGCHSLDAAGALGSANREVRNQGPNLNERVESAEDVLYAIRNGGFSGALMPQQILTGEDAEIVADFVAKYAGRDIDRPLRPGAEPAGAEGGTGPSTSFDE